MGTVDWSTLPTLVLEQVYMCLLPESRLAASSTCKQWRRALYHPMFWQSFMLNIASTKVYADIESKVDYVNQHLVTLARNVHLSFDSRSPRCFELASSVINGLMSNQLLKNIDIELTHCKLSKDKM